VLLSKNLRCLCPWAVTVRSYWQWRGCGGVCHVLGELADLAVFNEADTLSYDVSILWSIPCTFPLLFTVSCGLLHGHLSWEHRKPGNVMEFGSVQEMSNLAGSASPVWRIFLQRSWSVEGWVWDHMTDLWLTDRRLKQRTGVVVKEPQMPVLMRSNGQWKGRVWDHTIDLLITIELYTQLQSISYL